MINLLWILPALIFLFFIARYFMLKMYDIPMTPHAETPEKFGIKFEACRFPTENDRSLYAWWIPDQKDPTHVPTLILVHGWSRNLGRMLRYIQHLHPMGFNLLAFDARHHGSSDPDGHGSMFKFGEDVRAAVQHVVTRDIDANKIGVVGLSIGGAGSIFASALEPRIKAVVTVGAPAHPADVMRHEFKKYHLPGFLVWLILKQIENTIGAAYEDFAPVNNISKSEASFLIIHGTEDKVVLPSQGDKLIQASTPGKGELWSIQGRGHSNCHHEPDFWDKLQTFLHSRLK